MGFDRLFIGVVLAGALSAVTACNVKDLALDPKTKAQAQTAYAQFVTGQDDALFAGMPPQTDTPMQRKMLAALRELVPTTKADSAEMIAWRTNAGTSGQTQLLVYRYDYGSDHVSFTTTFVRAKDDAPWILQGVNLSPSPPEQVSAPAQGGPAPIPPLKTEPAGS